MNIEKLLEQVENLDNNQKKELSENIQNLIDKQFIAKELAVDLQSQINSLTKENNIIQKNAAVKFSRQEHQTIAFQLGKNIIDVFNGRKSIISIPKTGLGLFMEAIQRKEKEELTSLQKSAFSILEFKQSLNEKNYKKTLVNILNNAIDKLKEDEHKKNEILEGEFRNIDFKKIQEKNGLDKDTSDLKIVNEIKPVIKQVLKSTSKDKNEKLKIACIMDEFTFFCFSPEADLLQLTPDNWLEELKDFQPDILFVESAWQGKESLWKAKVSQNSSEVSSLIKFCKINSIKTMFWNKEDPVHFGTFIDIAKQVDVVFTTDIDCIGNYKAQVGHDNVYLMPFAAQPKTHNPIEKYERKDAINFAGSFYLKYPERQRDFVNLTDVATKFRTLEIYDRNFNNPHPHYTFPEKYQQYILGRLEPHEIDKAYKGYIYGINMNTIKQSQSMFARRVFEMLASNTIVLSNYSRGVRNFFGDLVLCSDNPIELENKLDKIVHNKDLVDKFKLLGLRKVLSEHTYEDRMQYILSKLHIDREISGYDVCILSTIKNKNEFDRILGMFEIQDHKLKKLYILKPESLNLPEINHVSYFNNIDEVVEGIKKDKLDYISIFDEKNNYLESYLTDLVLSFKFLKYDSINVVTKSTYYDFDNQNLKLVENKEYSFVDGFDVVQSVFSKIYFIQNIDKLLSDENVKDKAFSIDRFNFVKNAENISYDSLKNVSSKLENIDFGVDLKSKLLPYAESISASTPDIDQLIKFDKDYFSKNIDKSFKKIKISDDILIDSNLELKEHKYLPIVTNLNKQSDEIELIVNAVSDCDASIAIEYFNMNNLKISGEVFGLNIIKNISLPKDTKYFNISLRLKGKGTVKLDNIEYKICANEKINEKNKNNSSLTVLDADIFKNGLVKGSSNQIQFLNNHADKMIIRTTLAPTKHCYLYLKDVFTRDQINLVLNSEFELEASTTAEEVRIVFEFQDENKQKISHSMNPILGGHALAIPMHCKYVRIGFKIVGKGETIIKKLSFGTVQNPVNDFIPKSDVLVVAKQYPAYDDLYKYGFLHSRIKGYKKENKIVDMFKVSNDVAQYGFREFEGIDIFTHGFEMLDKLLASGAYKKVCLHLIDNKMWDVVKKYQDKVQVIIWLHGAEIRSWERRAYESARMQPNEVERQKKLSVQRKKFWINLINNELNASTQFVFVSKYFLNESENDLGIKFPKDQCHVIHNFIDGNVFNFVEKNAEDRYKILSIRPYTNLGYANDLTVKTILELSKKREFKKFKFTICGEGELFSEVTAPLKKFNNVTLINEFLTHEQISKLHKEHGIFLVPTRIDSQGVSRDEAMSSGLVPVTNDVSAVSEFVDNSCGIVVNAEEYTAMSKGIMDLLKNPQNYLLMSKNAEKRVKMQSGFNLTIKKELMLFV